MISTTNISKKFGNVDAVCDITTTIKDGQVFGLIGTNGAGKSTFLRMVAGIIKPDSGSITIDGINVFNSPKAKEQFFYISDEQFYLSNSKPIDMANFYNIAYPQFDFQKFQSLMEKFQLPFNQKIKTYSKGMKKQLSVILGISANTKYILCDETFDGLDPVMRQAVKSVFAFEIEERGLTPIIASHNLREIDDICEHIGLLHKGGMLISNELDTLKLNLYKIQCIFKGDLSPDFFDQLNIVTIDKRLSLYTLTIRDNLENITQQMKALHPVFFEIIPLTLEEIFITETEAQGYDIKNIIQ